MNHFYQNIEGMMDYEDLYSEMVRKFPADSHFIEIGVWKGRSAAFMAVEILNSKKYIKFDIIDNFLKSSQREVEENLRMFDFVKIIKSNSDKAASPYPDQSLDFVFIDAEHSALMVFRDIKAWLPKIKKGGILAGHDYENPLYPDLKLAVDKLLPVKKVSKTCWYYEVSKTNR